MIVVDTTVWIDFLEARGTAFDRHLAELVENDAPIALVDIVSGRAVSPGGAAG